MNDYELVYLIQTEMCQVAFDFMYQKYRRFIWKQIHLLHVNYLEFDDFHQEGILMLLKAVSTFNEAKNKTFMRYFELILKRHYYHLVRRLPRYILKDEASFQQGTYYIDESIDSFLMTCSDIEQWIYQFYFVECRPIASIAEDLKLSKKQVYNTIYRIKEKYKSML